MTSRFLPAAERLRPRIIAWRRRIHQHPELGFQEWETARLVAEALREVGLEVQTGIAGTGVVGVLWGRRRGTGIALRADMDALPLTEKTGLPFASQRPGLMHACGHDAHVAMVLGAAYLLAEVRQELAGTVKLIFQPCEETPPGGALAMLRAGALSNPGVNAVVGLHVNPHLPVGTVGLKEGVGMAAVDTFTLTVRGKGGHSSSPHLAVDAIVVAAHAVLALRSLPGHLINPLDPVVVSVGTIHGGTKSNIVAEEVVLTGTVRTLSEEVRRKVPQLMRRLLNGVVKAYDASYELDYQEGYPLLINDAELLALVERSCHKVVGSEHTLRLPMPAMGSEDFAYFAQVRPAVHFDLGVGKPGGPNYPWHHPCFDLDENALPLGAALLAQICWDYLQEEG
ncbi:MAG: M20 metallopeptidase family protein [Moorellales bacterium]